MFVITVACFQTEVSATSRSLVQREALLNEVCRCVWYRNLNNEEAMAGVGLQRRRGENVLTGSIKCETWDTPWRAEKQL